MFNINTAFSQVKGTEEALEITQRSSAHYFQRPDKDYALLDPDRTSLAGSGGRMQLMKLNGHLNLGVVTLWKTPGFEINDLGYLQQADRIMPIIWVGYSQWEPKGIYRRFNINGDVWSFFNFGGVHVGDGLEGNVSMTFKTTGMPTLTAILEQVPMMQLCSGWTDNENTRKSSCQCRFLNRQQEEACI